MLALPKTGRKGGANPLTMALLTKVLFELYSHNLQCYTHVYLFHNHILQSHLFDICSHGIYCILRMFQNTNSNITGNPVHALEIKRPLYRYPDIFEVYCNFFSPYMASVHMHLVNSAVNPDIFEFALQRG